MSTAMQPVMASFNITNDMMNLALADVSDSDAKKRVRGDSGSSISWIVGHLCSYRYEIMKLLGTNKSDPFRERFREREATDGREYENISLLLGEWNRIHAELCEVASAATDDQLKQHRVADGRRDSKRPVMDTLVSFMWHEAYHVGQIGTIRTLLGYSGTADLVAR